MRMSYTWAGVVLACALSACALVGCTPGGGDPSPVVSAEITPTVVETATPTLQWTPAEQAAVDAVQAYIDKWTYIAQNLPDVDVNSIYQVAANPVAKTVLLQWASWEQAGWHLVGNPVFEPTHVASGALDDLGQRYHVYGCSDLSQAYLVDESGVQIQKSGDRMTVLYLVLTTPDNGSGVLEETVQEDSC